MVGFGFEEMGEVFVVVYEFLGLEEGMRGKWNGERGRHIFSFSLVKFKLYWFC